MEFKFKPGDIVTTAVEAHLDKPPRFMVLERLTQECYEGIQRHYDVRNFVTREDGVQRQAALRLVEFEVVAYPTDEELAGRRAKRQEQEEAMWGERAARRARKVEA